MNLADFGTPVVIGGKYKVAATEAYLQAISSADLGKASAISVPLLLPAVAAFWLYGRGTFLSQDILQQGRKMRTEWNGDYRLPPMLPYLAAGYGAAFFAVMALKYGNTFLNTVSNTSTGHIQFTLKVLPGPSKVPVSSFCHSLVLPGSRTSLRLCGEFSAFIIPGGEKIKGLAARNLRLPCLISYREPFRPWLCGSIQPSAVSAAEPCGSHSVKLRVSSDFLWDARRLTEPFATMDEKDRNGRKRYRHYGFGNSVWELYFRS